MRLAILLLSFSWTLARAQLQTLDVNGAGIGFGSVKFNNPALIGEKGKVDYSEIRGNYFWDNQWSPGILVLSNNSAVKLRKVRMNLYTNEVHYIDNKNVELAANNSIVKKVLLLDRKDSTKVTAVFENFASYKTRGIESFAQVLNQGKAQLLKRVTVTVKKGEYDVMMGKSELSFVWTTDYFILNDGKITLLKRINKEGLFSILEPNDEYEAWLKSTKNRLKSEEDLLAFLTFYNTQKK